MFGALNGFVLRETATALAIVQNTRLKNWVIIAFPVQTEETLKDRRGQELTCKRCLGIKVDRNGARQGGRSLERTSETENLRKKDENSGARMTSTVLKLDLNT